MAFFRCALLAFLLLSSWAAAQSCKLQFDGRVPAAQVAADFDAPNKFFSEKFVLGQGLKFDQALRLLPTAAGSLVSLKILDSSMGSLLTQS